MSSPDRTPLDQLRLSEEAARRLLDRASELDAARGRTLTVAHLREAAHEAGISVHAFDAALLEMEQASPVPATPTPVPAMRPRRRAARRFGLVVGVAAAAAMLGVLGSRLVVSSETSRIVEAPVEVIVTPSSADVQVHVDTVLVTTTPVR